MQLLQSTSDLGHHAGWRAGLDDRRDEGGEFRCCPALVLGKLDVDANIQTAGRYQIRGIPTLLVFKGGKVVDQKVGAVGKADVKKMLDAHV